MFTYWKNNNQLMQIDSNDTPTLLNQTITNNEWQEITKEEYEALIPKETLVFRDDETIESGWKAEEVQNEN